MSQGIGRPEKRGRYGGCQIGGAFRTYIFIKFTILYGHSSWLSQTITIVTQRSLITNHCNKILPIIKSFELMRGLPKCDTDTSVQMLLENWRQQTQLAQGCHKPSVHKNHNICEAQESKEQQNEVCLYTFTISDVPPRFLLFIYVI